MTENPDNGHYDPALDDDYDDGECWNCGGEGRVAGTCIDGCCLEQDDSGLPVLFAPMRRLQSLKEALSRSCVLTE
ncbi:MAG: hypothetical protein NVS3B5_01610 [Sphingomicrobium sp.]